jgi:hypothetical protein
MIQRIQTIYMLLTALCMSLAILLPFSTYLVGENTLVFNSFGFTLANKQIAFMPLYPILISSALFALVSVFLYKARIRQLMINKINYLLILLVIVLMFIDFGSLDTALGKTQAMSYGIGMFLPVAALVFNFLANRGIKSDEKLIKSLDRLR